MVDNMKIEQAIFPNYLLFGKIIYYSELVINTHLLELLIDNAFEQSPSKLQFI